jgi:hypothetical protein
VQAPTKYELVINLKTVGRISGRRNPPTSVTEQPSGGLRFANPPYALTIPQAVLARADEVIE